MKFKIKRSDAVEAVKKCMAVGGRGRTLPILSCIRIDAKDGHVVMTSSDLDRWIICTVPAEVSTKGAAALSARILSGIFSAGEDAEVEVDSKLKCTIQCGGSKFKFPALNADEMPDVPDSESWQKVTLSAASWIESSSAVSWAASTSTARLTLNGTLLEHSDEGLKFVATDGTRLCQTHADYTGRIQESIIIPTSTMAVMNSISANGGELTLAMSEGFIGATCGDDMMISKLIEGGYPNYRQVIPKWDGKTITRITIPSSEFAEKLDRIAMMNAADMVSVNLDVTANHIALSSRSTENEATSSIDVQTEGKPISINFNAVFLSHPFRRWEGDEITLEAEDGMSPGILRSGNHMCVLMPIRAQQ